MSAAPGRSQASSHRNPHGEGTPVHTLALQQQALLDALFQRPGGDGAARARQTLDTWLVPHNGRGLAAYQTNGHALAERTLQAAYPVIGAMLGEQNLSPLARRLWHREPPVRGDLAHWGGAFASCLEHEEQLAHLLYLADVARVEWAMHLASGAPDAQTDAGSFARLANEDPQSLTLALAAGAAVFTSAWPIASLITAHREGQPGLDAAADRLRDGVGESAVVWRQGLRPCVAGCTAAEALWLGALLHGQPVTDALTLATACDDSFDLSTWLAHAVQQGLVVGVVDALAPSHTPPTEEAP